jgi:hypothetical protein
MAHKESESIINRAHIEESYANARNTGVSDRVSLEVNDRFDAEIRKATLVASLFTAGREPSPVCRFLRELKPGTRVVSHNFNGGDWKRDLRHFRE